MNGQQIVNMRTVSDRQSELGLVHYNQFNPTPIGQIEIIDGKEYRCIDNMSQMIVTYEPVVPPVQDVAERQVVRIPFTESDLWDLMNNEEFEWSFPDQHGVNVELVLYRDDSDPDGEE